MMPSKTQLMTMALTLAVIWAYNNIDALEPVKDFMEG